MNLEVPSCSMHDVEGWQMAQTRLASSHNKAQKAPVPRCVIQQEDKTLRVPIRPLQTRSANAAPLASLNSTLKAGRRRRSLL